MRTQSIKLKNERYETHISHMLTRVHLQELWYFKGFSITNCVQILIPCGSANQFAHPHI